MEVSSGHRNQILFQLDQFCVYLKHDGLTLKQYLWGLPKLPLLIDASNVASLDPLDHDFFSFVEAEPCFV